MRRRGGAGALLTEASRHLGTGLQAVLIVGAQECPGLGQSGAVPDAGDDVMQARARGVVIVGILSGDAGEVEARRDSLQGGVAGTIDRQAVAMQLDGEAVAPEGI